MTAFFEIGIPKPWHNRSVQHRIGTTAHSTGSDYVMDPDITNTMILFTRATRHCCGDDASAGGSGETRK